MIYYLLYDDGCSLCVNFQEKVVRWDRRGLIKPVSFSDPQVAKIAPGMSREILEGSFHLVFPDGTVKSGHRAMPDLLMLLPGWGWLGWLLAVTPGADWLSGKIYRWIARKRGQGPCDQ